MKKLTEEWLKAAKDDLRVIDRIGQDEHLTHMIAFHAQQAVEKSLKAAIEEYGLGSVRVHSLERLFEIIRPYIKIDTDPLIVEDALKRFPAFPPYGPGRCCAKSFEEFYAQHFAQQCLYIGSG